MAWCQMTWSKNHPLPICGEGQSCDSLCWIKTPRAAACLHPKTSTPYSREVVSIFNARPLPGIFLWTLRPELACIFELAQAIPVIFAL